MPLYEYECESCGARIERIQQKFSDPLLQTCPTCGGQLRKLISSPAFQFKGSGFYITDYARKGGSDSKDPKDSKDAKDSKDSETSKDRKDSQDGKAAKEDSKGSKSDAGASSESTSSSKPSSDGPAAPAKTDTKP